MYAVLARDIDDFLDMLPEMGDQEIDDLYLMLSTPNPNPNTDAKLNILGAELVSGHILGARKRDIPKPLTDRFEIEVRVSTIVKLAVQSPTLAEAKKLAESLAMKLKKLPAPLSAQAGSFQLIDPDKPEIKLSTQTCAGCKAQTLKEEWGPGQLKCPACGRMAQQADVP